MPIVNKIANNILNFMSGKIHCKLWRKARCKSCF